MTRTTLCRGSPTSSSAITRYMSANCASAPHSLGLTVMDATVTAKNWIMSRNLQVCGRMLGTNYSSHLWAGGGHPERYFAPRASQGLCSTPYRLAQVFLLDYEQAHPEDITGDSCAICGGGEDVADDWISCDVRPRPPFQHRAVKTLVKGVRGPLLVGTAVRRHSLYEW